MLAGSNEYVPCGGGEIWDWSFLGINCQHLIIEDL